MQAQARRDPPELRHFRPTEPVVLERSLLKRRLDRVVERVGRYGALRVEIDEVVALLALVAAIAKGAAGPRFVSDL
jgi:hypothetical protein